ncbi:unnamed protein product [Polarella glacialis]|uniref:CS domain-containing protein n=1 Tax=Polarella glacialis TaxID=89957 RepID=A0A813E0P4_POLGL|nr:unnamed protein product [Polarella glacialis]
MAASRGLQPSVTWAQRQDSVFLTIDVKDATNVRIQLQEDSLEFAATAGEDGALYSFQLDFFKPISREESKWSTKRCPEFYLRKSSDETWPRLQKGAGKLQWVKLDWGKWADSDEEDEKGGFDTSALEDHGSGMDFSGLSQGEVEGSDDRDSILADLDEEIAIETDGEDVTR